MIGRIHADIFHQDQSMLGNVPIKIKFTPNPDGFVLLSAADVDVGHPQINYKFKIVDARLCIFTQEVSDSLAIDHEITLKK